MLRYYDPNSSHASGGTNFDKDYGTPAVRNETGVTPNSVSLIIDGQKVSVPEGTSVMRAAAEADINIPKLCATDSLAAFGSCRLCLVEIEGRKGTPSSCISRTLLFGLSSVRS